MNYLAYLHLLKELQHQWLNNLPTPTHPVRCGFFITPLSKSTFARGLIFLRSTVTCRHSRALENRKSTPLGKRCHIQRRLSTMPWWQYPCELVYFTQLFPERSRAHSVSELFLKHNARSPINSIEFFLSLYETTLAVVKRRGGDSNPR